MKKPILRVYFNNSIALIFTYSKVAIRLKSFKSDVLYHSESIHQQALHQHQNEGKYEVQVDNL